MTQLIIIVEKEEKAPFTRAIPMRIPKSEDSTLT